MTTAKKKKSLNPFDDDDDLEKKEEEMVQLAVAEKERVMEGKVNKVQAFPPLRDRETNLGPPPLSIEPKHSTRAEKGLMSL